MGIAAERPPFGGIDPGAGDIPQSTVAGLSSSSRGRDTAAGRFASLRGTHLSPEPPCRRRHKVGWCFPIVSSLWEDVSPAVEVAVTMSSNQPIFHGPEVGLLQMVSPPSSRKVVIDTRDGGRSRRSNVSMRNPAHVGGRLPRDVGPILQDLHTVPGPTAPAVVTAIPLSQQGSPHHWMVRT